MKIALGTLAVILLMGSMIVCAIIATAPAAPRVPALTQSQAATAATLNALPAYDTLEEAGVHAIARAYSCSHYYECGGPIAVRPDGKYVVGPAQSSGEGDHVEISPRVPVGLGWVLAADYHTHPCLQDTHHTNVFSPADIMGAISAKTIGFMGDLCTGEVHEFDPAKDSPNNIEVEPGLYVTQGRIVGKIPVDGASVEPNVGL